MLAEAAHGLNYCVWVLGENPKSPAAGVADRFFLKNQEHEFFNDIDFLTFENEFFKDQNLESKVNTKTFVFPSFKNIYSLRDKWEQKKLLQQLQIPTASARIVHSLDELSQLSNVVLKWSQGGYDGKGTFVLRNSEKLMEAEKFYNEGVGRGAKIYAEDFVPFALEMAILIGKDKNGNFFNLPLVESFQENNICRYVKHLSIKEDLRNKIYSEVLKCGKKLLEKLHYVGVLAMELFLTHEGEFLVNELAPRVHNSGHYSLSACDLNQFKAHWMAALNSEKKFPDIKSSDYFVMWNILGPSNAQPQNLEALDFGQTKENNIDLYWYNKLEVKAWRKMGHLSAIARSAQDENRLLKEMQKWEKNFWLKNLK
jgi:5-(carboxyamino)imidazole ribonucleotide synthase